MAQAENNILNRIRLALSQAGVLNWRNHCGMLKDSQGRTHKFGLCPGSSDIVGMVPVEITADMVGKTVGVFMAVEVKTSSGRLSKKQKNFIAVVQGEGGIAGVARSPEEAIALVRGDVKIAT